MQNKRAAMKLLAARMEAHRVREQQPETGRREEAAFGRQIRSYTLHPKQQVRDHRTGISTGNAQAVLRGELHRIKGHE